MCLMRCATSRRFMRRSCTETERRSITSYSMRLGRVIKTYSMFSSTENTGVLGTTRYQRCSYGSAIFPSGCQCALIANSQFCSGSRPCENVFFPQKLHAAERNPLRRDRLRLFCCIESGGNPGATSGHAERPERSHGAHNGTRSSSPDRREERFDTDDVHHAREVVGEHVQRHLGRHLRQRLHQKVRRTHPHL